MLTGAYYQTLSTSTAADIAGGPSMDQYIGSTLKGSNTSLGGISYGGLTSLNQEVFVQSTGHLSWKAAGRSSSPRTIRTALFNSLFAGAMTMRPPPWRPRRRRRVPPRAWRRDGGAPEHEAGSKRASSTTSRPISRVSQTSSAPPTSEHRGTPDVCPRHRDADHVDGEHRYGDNPRRHGYQGVSPGWAMRLATPRRRAASSLPAKRPSGSTSRPSSWPRWRSPRSPPT